MDVPPRSERPAPRESILTKVTPSRQAITLFGDYWWGNREPVPTGALLAALGDMGVKEAAARATLSQLVRNELLVSERVGRRTTHQLTERGAQQIAEEVAWLETFGRIEPRWDGLWSVVAFSVPETRRAARHSARSRLKWLGFAPLYDGVWISPTDAAKEAMEQLRSVDIDDVTIMRARLDRSLPEGPQAAWDPGATRRLYEQFTAEVGSCPGLRGAAALAARSRVMLMWQRFRTLDVGLPLELLPTQWPRSAARQRFVHCFNGLGPAAEERMREHVAAISPELSSLVCERRLTPSTEG